MNATHPGRILLNQHLAAQNISQNRLANTLGVPPRRINEIVLGKRAITADTAVRLAAYFGNSASYWMHLQAEYDIALARDKISHELSRIQIPTPEPESIEQNEAIDEPESRIRSRIMR
jgi:addiction module HigA family antidote